MRRVAPLVFSDLAPADLAGQVQPDFDLVDPRTLFVDEAYQRGLGPRSLPVIRRIFAEFRWSKFKPPICVRVDGTLHVVDGQHTAVACASHPGISVIPVIVVDEPAMVDRARAFISHARDRVAVTPGQVWKAEVTAGEPDAVAIQSICSAAGVTLLPFSPTGGAYKVRETVALAAIKALLARRGAEQTALVLTSLADAELAPIDANSIKAAEALLCDPDYAADFDIERLAASFRALGTRAQVEAKELAAAKGLPMWRALVATIYKHRKGRAPASALASPAIAKPAGPPANPLRRIIDRTPLGGVVPIGEPPAGRSALDQRRARA